MRTDHFYGYIRPILSSPIPTSLPPLPPPSPPLSLPLVLHTSHAGSRIYKPPTFPWTTSILTSVFGTGQAFLGMQHTSLLETVSMSTLSISPLNSLCVVWLVPVHICGLLRAQRLVRYRRFKSVVPIPFSLPLGASPVRRIPLPLASHLTSSTFCWDLAV
ncbi:hypothetical protein PM082_023654 [Marasmius tenuissimus]|nr:hypothetical protein PM082_023654 [Marasmius tenuissimus]